jgi:hypothetical protein
MRFGNVPAPHAKSVAAQGGTERFSVSLVFENFSSVAERGNSSKKLSENGV